MFSKNDRSDKSIRFRECDGFGHYQAECAAFLKQKKKSLTVTLCDDEASSDSKSKEFGKALISITITNEPVEDGCSCGQKKFVTCVYHQGSSSYVTSDNDDLLRKWEEDQIILKEQKERVQVLMEQIDQIVLCQLLLLLKLN